MTQLLATFTTRDEAGRAAQRLTHDFPDVEVTGGDQEDALDAVMINQRAETDESIVTASVGLWSGPMARGALVWGVVGLVVGALLALPLLLLFDFPDGQEWVFVAAVAVAGALGLSS